MPESSRPLPALRALIFLSGFSGLVLEVVWTRLVSSIVGATSVGMTCIFFVFILSLALGSLLGSFVRVRGGQAVRLYGLLELLIGITGYAVTLVMLRHSPALANWAESLPLPHSLAAHLFLTALLIGFPSTLMGLTLPVILNALQGGQAPREQVASLYGLNMAGGACGALFSGFVMIWSLGVSGTAAAICFLNALICLSSIAISGAGGGPQELPPPAADEPEQGAASTRIFLLAFVCGAGSLTFELLWGRVAKLFLGDRTIAASSLLFVYLACMALGSFAVARFRRRASEEPKAVLFQFGLLLAIGSALQLFALSFMRYAISQGLNEAAVSVRLFYAFGAMFLPVAVLGVAFPLLMTCSPGLNRLPAKVSGLLYACNSIGSAFGAVLGGYLIPRTIGTIWGFAACALVMSATGAICARSSGPSARPYRALGGVAAALIAAFCLLPSDLHFYNPKETLLRTHEDEYGIQLVTKTESGLLKVKNNRLFIAYHFGHPSTTAVQESIALFSCLVSARCEHVLNIGTGYGITAGAFTLFDELETLKTVEVLPFVCDNQELFSSENREYYKDPRVTRVCTDGRRFLLADDSKYDVISVNVMDPYLPGSSALFTVDFWREARAHLAPGGIYSQLIWGPDTDTLLRGMQSVFGRLLIYRTSYENAYNVLALPEDIREFALKLSRVNPGIFGALQRQGVGDAGLFLRQATEFASYSGTRFMLKNDWPFPPEMMHTDDRPNLEFKWWHGADYISSFDSLQAHDFK